MSDFIYYSALFCFAAMFTAAFIWIMIRVVEDVKALDKPSDNISHYRKLPTAQKAVVGDTVKIDNNGLIFWGLVQRIDGPTYSVIVSNVEKTPDDYPPAEVPEYGQTVHIFDPHISFVFRAPVHA
jgi:hypothetical protein